MLIADARVDDAVQPLLTSSDSKLDAVTAQFDNDDVTDRVSNDVMSAGVSGDIGGVDPSRLPQAQRQLFMRIQQKQQRDDKPISDITAKRACLRCF